MLSKARHRAEAFIFAVSAILIVSVVAFLSLDNSINRTNIEYISSFGWQVEEKPVEIFYMTVPQKNDAVFSAYGKIVNLELDLNNAQKVTRYSYKVLNHKKSESGFIRINLFLSNGKILWGDVSSLAPGGFILPINDISDMVK